METTGKRVLAGSIGMITAAGAGISTLFVGGMNRAADIARMADQFQVPIDLMAKLKHAADEAGVSVDEVMNDTTGRFSGAVARAPGMDEGQARRALQIQKDWNNALRDLQYTLLPLVEVTAQFSAALARLAKNMSAKGAVKGIGDVAVDFITADSVLGVVDVVKEAMADIVKGAAAPKLPAVAMRATDTKGAFQTFGAMGQFGFGNNNSEVKKLTEIEKRLRELLDQGKLTPEAFKRAITPK